MASPIKTFTGEIDTLDVGSTFFTVIRWRDSAVRTPYIVIEKRSDRIVCEEVEYPDDIVFTSPYFDNYGGEHLKMWK